MKLSSAIVITTFLLIFFLVFVIKQGQRSPTQYRHSPLLTDNEIEFYGRIREALPWACIQVQTALSAIIQPIQNMTPKSKMAAFGRIAQKRVDFLICHEDLSVVCVIELDDKTHNKSNDAQRDWYLSSAGIKTIRYESKSTLRPNVERIRKDIAEILAKAPKTSSILQRTQQSR